MLMSCNCGRWAGRGRSSGFVASRGQLAGVSAELTWPLGSHCLVLLSPLSSSSPSRRWSMTAAAGRGEAELWGVEVAGLGELEKKVGEVRRASA